MALYRDEITIVTLPAVRAGIAPRVFRKLTAIKLTFGERSEVVALARVAGHGCIGKRVAFVCPCGATACVLAFTYVGLTCRKCTPWKSRGYRVSGKAPHVGHVAADIAV